jgi:predicted HTH domain antitoxin
MATISVDLPAETLEALRQSSDELAHDLRVAAAIYWYAQGRLSQERAAQAAGLNRQEFILAVGRAGVNIFQSDAEEFGL